MSNLWEERQVAFIRKEGAGEDNDIMNIHEFASAQHEILLDWIYLLFDIQETTTQWSKCNIFNFISACLWMYIRHNHTSSDHNLLLVVSILEMLCTVCACGVHTDRAVSILAVLLSWELQISNSCPRSRMMLLWFYWLWPITLILRGECKKDVTPVR